MEQLLCEVQIQGPSTIHFPFKQVQESPELKSVLVPPAVFTWYTR